MAGHLSGDVNVISVLGPTYSTNTTLTYSDYVKLDKYDQVTFVAEYGALSRTTLGSSAGTCTGQCAAGLYSAYSATGGGVTALGFYTTMGSTTEGTAYIDKAHSIITTLSSRHFHGETLAINGVTFTFSTVATVTTGTFDSNRYIYCVADNSSMIQTSEHLAAYINHPVYGCTGVHAEYNNARINVATSSSGNVLITGQGNVSVTVQATSSEAIKPVNYVSLLECRGADLLANTSHKYVCVGLTPTSICVIGAVALRNKGRFAADTGSVEDIAYST